MSARAKAAMLTVAGTVVLAGCSEKKQRPPTEQEIHARDFDTVGGVRGRHLYNCDDGEPLFVDFKDEGLSIELRPQEQGPAETLSAPAQGLQFVGNNASVTMTGHELRYADAQGRTRVCRKQ